MYEEVKKYTCMKHMLPSRIDATWLPNVFANYHQLQEKEHQNESSINPPHNKPFGRWIPRWTIRISEHPSSSLCSSMWWMLEPIYVPFNLSFLVLVEIPNLSRLVSISHNFMAEYKSYTIILSLENMSKIIIEFQQMIMIGPRPGKNRLAYISLIKDIFFCQNIWAFRDLFLKYPASRSLTLSHGEFYMFACQQP